MISHFFIFPFLVLTFSSDPIHPPLLHPLNKENKKTTQQKASKGAKGDTQSPISYLTTSFLVTQKKKRKP
jgi:hypothetical protein